MKRIFAIILCSAIVSCNGISETTPTSIAAFTATPSATITLTPTATTTSTPRPTRTPTPIPWQSYKMTYSIKISNVGKLWMPIPREWDGIGMTDVSVIDISPQPDDTFQDNQGNMIAFWNVGYRGAINYSITFYVDLAPIKYVINPNQISDYDKSSPEYQRYTQPSSRIESDNEIIIQLAKQIVGSETNPYKQARLIHAWVSNNIRGPGEDGETALSTLENLNGSCGGHSFLFVALLRSLGIPARDVGGLHTDYEGSFTDGSFWEHTLYTHVWSEFYLPNYGWIQSDTSGGLQNFAEINEHRIVLFHGEDIVLGHDFPSKTVPWFHIPHVDLMINEGDPRTQWPGDSLTLTVEKLP